MEESLRDLIRISRVVGADSSLVQGGGGNTSAKTADGKYMYVKASGTALKSMSSLLGWRRLDLGATLAMLKDRSIARLDPDRREKEVVRKLGLCCRDDQPAGARPSVESHMHAMLDRYVIHLHPTAVGSYVCSKKGRSVLERLFRKEKLPILWVPYTDPGFTLAKKIEHLIGSYERRHGAKPAVVFLGKHGLLVSAASPSSAMGLVRKVVKVCRSRFRKAGPSAFRQPSREKIKVWRAAIRDGFCKATDRRVPVTHIMDQHIARFMKRKDVKKLVRVPSLAPDELVYAGGPPVWLERCDAEGIAKILAVRVSSGEGMPLAFIVRGIGLFVIGRGQAARTVADVVTAMLEIRARAVQFGGPMPLSKPQRLFIAQWEAESFRKKLTA